MKQNTNPFRGLILMLCILALIFCATSIFRTTSHQTEYSYADIRALFEEKKVDKVLVDDDTLTLTLEEPLNGAQVVTYSLYNFDLFYNDFNDLVVQQWKDGIISDYEYPDSPSPAWMGNILTWVVVLAVMALLWYFLFLRRAQGGGGPSATQFGKVKARTLAETGRTVTFADVAGADEEKEELAEVVDFLRQPAQYLLEFETMSAEDFQLVFQPPEVLERRKAEERVQRTRQAEEKAAEQARLQAAREAEMARRLQEADEAAQSKEDETPPPPQNPDPF